MGTFACANSDEFKWGWWLRLVRTLTNFKKGLSALAWLAVRCENSNDLKMGSRWNLEINQGLWPSGRPAAVGLCEL